MIEFVNNRTNSFKYQVISSIRKLEHQQRAK